MVQPSDDQLDSLSKQLYGHDESVFTEEAKRFAQDFLDSQPAADKKHDRDRNSLALIKMTAS